MLVVMQEGATEAQVEKVIDRLVAMGFTVHRSTGVRHTVLGGVGPLDQFEPADFEVMEGVKECHRIVSPYKMASRHFRPDGTVVRDGRRRDRRRQGGGDGGTLQRGEPRADFPRCRRSSPRPARRCMRGGAFKPRTSPYSFQGMGEEGFS